VLKLLAEYFCLSIKDLCILIYAKYNPSTRTSVGRTLGLLQEEHCVDWRKLPSRIRKAGNDPAIYGLTLKGVTKVADEGFLTPTTKVFKPNSDTLMPHEYEITQFHLALKHFCDTERWKLYWQQYDLKCGVNPDACFGITTEKGTLWYFLEIEKTKPGNFRDGESKIIRNLGKYYNYFDTDKCEKEWANFRKFRVIVTLKNDERRQNLLNELAGKYKHRMFWLTTEELYKKEVSGEIFATPKDFASTAYSFPLR
jgi:hypothetical protein